MKCAERSIRVVTVFLCIFLLVPLTGCFWDAPGNEQPLSYYASEIPQAAGRTDRLRVVATAFPYYDFARAVGGDRVDVTLLVPAGRETHSFEPTPMDVVTISECDVFLYNGGESEYWVEEVLKSAGENIPVTMAMMDLVGLAEEEFVDGMQVSEHGEEEEEETEYDEHIWTSPVLARELMWDVCGALCKADWDGADYYTDNAAAYEAELEALDLEFRDVVEHASRRTLVFGDRFPLLYFCREYGLSYSAAFHGCASDTEPSLATLKYLIDKVDEEHIPVVYTIELSSQKIAQAIADATGAKVLTFQSCQQLSREDWENGETYVSLMHRNVEALREGLS